MSKIGEVGVFRGWQRDVGQVPGSYAASQAGCRSQGGFAPTARGVRAEE